MMRLCVGSEAHLREIEYGVDGQTVLVDHERLRPEETLWH
jgi:hypothetical protein